MNETTSGHNPNSSKTHPAAHYALVCYSDLKLTLGGLGYCDLAQCVTAKNGKHITYLVGARLLSKSQPPLIASRGVPSQGVRSVAFQASLIGHCYVKLKEPRVLTQPELDSLRQYSAGDDWLGLAKKLRP